MQKHRNKIAGYLSACYEGALGWAPYAPTQCLFKYYSMGTNHTPQPVLTRAHFHLQSTNICQDVTSCYTLKEGSQNQHGFYLYGFNVKEQKHKHPCKMHARQHKCWKVYQKPMALSMYIYTLSTICVYISMYLCIYLPIIHIICIIYLDQGLIG